MSNRDQGDDLDQIQNRLNKARRNRTTAAGAASSSSASVGASVVGSSSSVAAASTRSAPGGTWDSVSVGGASAGGTRKQKKMGSPLAGLRKGLSSTRGAFGKAASSRRIVAQDQSINLRNQESFASPVMEDPSSGKRMTAMSRLGTQASARSLMNPPFADEFMNDAAPNVESEEYLESDMKNRDRVSPVLAAILGALIDCYASISYHGDRLYHNFFRGGGGARCAKVLLALAAIGGGAYGVSVALSSDGSGNGGGGSALPLLKGRAGDIMRSLVDAGITPAEAMSDPGSVQRMALDWIANVDPAQLPIDHPALVERYALAVFHYGSSSGTGWKRSDNWMTGAGHCSWHGVQCVARDDETQESGISRVYNDSDAITSIVLNGNGMSGRIPAEFGKLSNTLNLELGNNAITGELPPLHANLKYLLVPDNKIEGSFPKHFQDLTNLHGLDLSNNRMENSISNHINRLKALRTLLLSDNKFDGLFPDISELSMITRLHLQNNRFNGPIPGTLRNYERLEILRLDNNTFTGPFPTQSLERLRKLEYLDMSNNDLTGPIPEIFDSIRHLTVLHLQHNRFRSTMPSTMTHLSDLKSLRLDHNVFTGTIPDSVAMLADVKHVALNDNHFDGEIPSYIGFVDDIAFLSLKNNRLSGTVPTELAGLFRLTHLELEGNSLTGNVPSELGSLSVLAKVSVHENELSGVTMPVELCDRVRRGEMEQLTSDCGPADSGKSGGGGVRKVSCDCCTECYPIAG